MQHRPSLIAVTVAAASLVAWVALATGRGQFWRTVADAHFDDAPQDGRLPHVEAVVPARDEAQTIALALASLGRQRYAGSFAITLVDDASSDATARVGSETLAAVPAPPPFAVVAAGALPPRWTGKLNALGSGLAAARRTRGQPDYWLFTDADIVHDPRNVAGLVAKAEREQLDLASLMVRLRCETSWERLLAPAFVFYFSKLYPFAWANDPRRATAAAAGGCLLVRASALERVGGLAAISDRLIDDCALAALVKRSGGRIWLGSSVATRSVRPYGTLATFWSMVKRTAFTQLGRSYKTLAATVAGMVVLYIAPPAFALAGILRGDVLLAALGAAGYATMVALYAPTLRAYQRPRREALALPLAAAFYTVMTLDSALAHARRRGGRWKGRTYYDAAGRTTA